MVSPDSLVFDFFNYLMAPKVRTLKSLRGNLNDFEELWFNPRPGPGKESRSEPARVNFLKRVKILGGTGRKKGRHGSISRGRGRPVFARQRLLRRVVIKSRVVKTSNVKSRGIFKHVRYLQRDGVGLNGREPEAFNQSEYLSRDEVYDWAAGCVGDRHHFRFIISPENGSELDLPAYARELMNQMEKDLGTKLSWVGVTHHNTDNPHIHIILKGRDDLGKDLVINRDYISHGMRIKAQEIATRELGFRTDTEIQQELRRNVTQDRPVGFDYKLRSMADEHPNGLVDLRGSNNDWDPYGKGMRNFQLGRLQYLDSLGLATEISAAVWKLDDNMLGKLRDLSIRNDIIKTMHRRMRGLQPGAEVNILDSDHLPSQTIEGTVVHVGLADELYDKKYLLVEDSRKRFFYISTAERDVKADRDFEIGDSINISVRSERGKGLQRNVLVLQGIEHGHAFDLKPEL